MSLLRRTLTPSLVVALLALVVALSGSAYAAARLAAGSVGTVQLKAGAVTSAKVRNGSLTLQDFAAKERARLTGPRGATGARGPVGPVGPTGSDGIAKVSGTTVRGSTPAGALAAGTTRSVATLATVPVEQQGATLRVTYVGQAAGTAGATCIFQLRVNDADTVGNQGPGPYVAATAGAGVALDGAASLPLTLDATFVGVARGTASIEVYAASPTAGTSCDVGSTTVAGSVTVEEYEL